MRHWRRALFVVAAIGVVAFVIYQRIQVPNVATLPQMWASSGIEYANTDSIAAAKDATGRVCVYATAKWGDRLDVFDAETGQFLKSVGKGGEAPGEFRRPNGIAIVRLPIASSDKAESKEPQPNAENEHAIVVVEREGARVQLLGAGDCQPLGMVGERILKRPYGAAVSYREESPLLYITDTQVTPDKTVSVFRLTRTADGLAGELVRQFGDAGAGRIHKAESIVVDDENNRVLLCDEDRSQRNVKVYDLAGRFTGRTFGDGIIGGDPEGIVIVEASAGDFILVTEQRSKITIWHAFDRGTLDFITSFTGEPRIANTDGIGLYTDPFATHKAGAMFAVNDDADVRAYDLKTIIDFVRKSTKR